MTFAGTDKGPCTICGMDRSLDSGLCFDCKSATTPEQNQATWQEIIKLELRVAELEHRFRHYHVNNGKNDRYDDSCKQCGLDLRDQIHTRA